jgi:hypothetical protein
LTDGEALVLDAALDALPMACASFAEAVARGLHDEGERWAAFAFDFWDAFEPLDPRKGGWTARLVALVEAS